MPGPDSAARPEAAFDSPQRPPNFASWLRFAPWFAAAAAITAFSNSLGNHYAYDDVPIVAEGSRIQRTGGWLDIWTTDYWYDLRQSAPNRDLLYRPLVLTSIKMVLAISGNQPAPQRLVNIALHALIAYLLVRFCRQAGASGVLALACGVFFAVLPIHSEAVNSIVGRADLLVTLFAFLAMGCHARSCRASPPSRVIALRLGAAACVFAAMASKENGIAAVPLVLLADLYGRRRSAHMPASRRWLSFETAWRLVYLSVPLMCYLALRLHALDGHFTQGPPATATINALVGIPFERRILGVIQLWGMYWAKTIWPATLAIKYTIPAVGVATSPLCAHVILGAAVLAASGWTAWVWSRRKNYWPAFFLAALVISYVPTSNSLVLIQEFFAERLWYFPSFFAAAFVSVAAAPTTPRSRRIAIGLTVVLCTAMVARCWRRNIEWKDNSTLYAAAYRDLPNAIGVLQLYGDWLTRNGHVEQGIVLLHKALGHDPGYVDAHRSLADAYLQSGDAGKAAEHLEKIARLVPAATPYNNLGVSYARQGRMEEAEKMFRLALADFKAAPFAHYNLGMICYRTGRVDDAIAHLEESIRLDSGDETAIGDLGRLYVSLGRAADAVRVFSIGTRQAPDNSHFWTHLATLLATSHDDGVRDGKLAVRAATKANELTGNVDPTSLAALASAQAETGAFALSVQTARKALALSETQGNASLADGIRAQMANYEKELPYRDPRF